MTPKTLTPLFCLLIIFGLNIQIPDTRAGTPHQKGSLKGFTGLHVISPQLPKNLASIDTVGWKVHLEKKIQMAHIEIVNTQTLVTGKLLPSQLSHHRLVYLRVALREKETASPTPLYHLRVTGYNKIDLLSTPNPQHIIWEAGTLVPANTKQIKNQTEALMGEFIKDFQRANPHKTFNHSPSR